MEGISSNNSSENINQARLMRLAPKRNWPLLTAEIILLLAILAFTFYNLKLRNTNNSLTVGPENTDTRVSETSPAPTQTSQETALFSGKLKKLDRNLKLFKNTESDRLNNIPDNFIYYEAGIFNKGELKDYTRVIAIRPNEGPGEPLTFVLATKDFKTYVLDDPENKTSQFPEDDYQNPYYSLDKNIISGVKKFDTEQPVELDLDRNMALFNEKYLVEYQPTGRTDSQGNKISEPDLVKDLSSYRKINSPFTNLFLYYKPFRAMTENLDQMNPEDKNRILLRQQYILGDTEVIAVDSTGLPVAYALTAPGNIRRYLSDLSAYRLAWKNYLEQVKIYNAKPTGPYPNSPDYVYAPNLGFDKSEIRSNKNLSFFNNYRAAIPNVCAMSLNSWVVNIAANDLEQIATVRDQPLYRLKDPNHPLNSLAYSTKMDYYNLDPPAWDQVNPGTPKPDLAQYIDKNPLLFIKDFWGRWVALGEYDIKIPGGCGKPVIYLYPDKPSVISVRFRNPVQLSTDIPKYDGSWQVKANPDGSLFNLKPELTDCNKIDSGKKGSEYATAACRKNIYPYLYWSGNVSSEYPGIDQGWIVGKNDLDSFLNNKLGEMGLNKQEKQDFISYWLPEMQSKNMPYYRISFLQTQELNSLFPMIVEPQPDTVFRIFLDYLPLTGKPSHPLQPQTLNKLNRNGFTLVEWGGLKR